RNGEDGGDAVVMFRGMGGCEDDVWRGGVEREKVVCRLLAGVGVAGNLAGKDGGAGKRRREEEVCVRVLKKNE
ncbi:hypothetical protein Tco_1331892, partial [Tanacetum coccineum]